MNAEELNRQQERNYRAALSVCEIEADYLPEIVTASRDAKEALKTILGAETLIFKRPLSQGELECDCYLFNLYRENPDYAFSFTAKHVTERATGTCTQLKKWLEKADYPKEEITRLLDLCAGTKTLFLSCNPFFLLGSSVCANGDRLDNSCHYPGGASGGTSYPSGTVSYALDGCTLVAGTWSDNGLTGRQLIHLDTENRGLLACRLYGNMCKEEAKALRKEIYKLFQSPDWKKTAHFTYSTAGFHGYSDTPYFECYRQNQERAPEFVMSAPLCISCGNEHSKDEISCCSESGRYTCAACGDRVREDDVYRTDAGDTYCESCYYERYFYCDACGETCNLSEQVEIRERGRTTYVCRDCAESKGYALCTDCDTWTDDYTCYNDECYCSDCLPEGETCDKCGEYFAREDLTETQENSHYCAGCLPRRADKCTMCGEFTESANRTGDLFHPLICDTCSGTLTPCKVCGEVYVINNLNPANPLCSHECATDNLFRGEN